MSDKTRPITKTPHTLPLPVISTGLEVSPSPAIPPALRRRDPAKRSRLRREGVPLVRLPVDALRT